MTSSLPAFLVQYIRGLAGSRPDAPPCDRDLLRRFAAGRDREAFAALVGRHAAMVWHVCRRSLPCEQDAEDAFQATFLVLAQKAGAVSWQDSVAGWLHAVAARVALKARSRATRHLALPGGEPVVGDPLEEITGRELLAALDEEVSSLPEKNRAPLLLCCLEGFPQEQAARLLGTSLSTLRRRLDLGRGLLRARLTRRGLSLSAALAAAEASRGVALPATLAEATVWAATGTAETIPARVAALAESARRGAALTRAKLALAFFLTVGVVVAGAGALARNTLPPKRPQAPPAAPGPAAAGSPEGKARTDVLGDPLPPHAVARMGTVRLRHGGEVWALAFSPDRNKLASGGRDGTIPIWEVRTGKLVTRLVGHTGWVMSVSFSPDGKLLASRGGWKDQTLRLWDVAAGKEIRRFGVTHPGYGAVAFAPDGKVVALNEDSAVRLWDVATAQPLRSFSMPGQRIQSSAFSPDGKSLAVACDADPPGRRGPPTLPDGRVFLWETATGKQLGTLRAAREGCTALAFAPDGRTLAVSTSPLGGYAVRLWAPAAGKLLRTIPQGPEEAHVLAFSPDSKTLAVGGRPGVRLWDLDAGKELRRFRGHSAGVNVVAFSPDGKVLASGCFDSTVRLWDVATGKALHAADAHEGRVLSVAFSPDGKLLGTGGEDGQVRLWHAATGQPFRLPGRHDREAYGVAFSPDGILMATGSWDETIKLWDLKSGREVRTLKGHRGEVWFVAFSPDSQTLASGHRDGVVRLWDVASGKERRLLAGHEGAVFGVTFAPDGRVVASAGSDKTIRLWDVPSGRELGKLSSGPDGRCWGLAFAPDGRTLASVCHGDPEVHLWEMATGQERARLAGPEGGVAGATFLPDGRGLAAAGMDGSVRLWDLPAGRERCRFRGHCGSVNAVAVAADGKLLASGGDDTTALVWQVPGQTRDTPPLAGTLRPNDLEALWEDLASADAGKAGRAIARLVSGDVQAVPYLKGRLRPTPSATRERLARLLDDLDSADFAVREKATRELKGLGKQAELLVRQLLQGGPSLEVRRRLEGILAALQARALSPDELQAVRALEVLEAVGTRQARQALRVLASGKSTGWMEHEARASLGRLGRGPAAPE